VVPTVNDSDDELGSIATWIAAELGSDTPWHVTRFTPYLEFADLPATPLSTLERAREIGREAGLDFVYLGNVDVPGAEDTICPRCGARAVSRRGFSALAENLASDGSCASCSAPLNITLGMPPST
jgi:pyruvate formate lyase activating enzyme